MKTRLLWIVNAIFALALVGQMAYARIQMPTTTAHAVWAFKPKSFAEVRGKADLVVETEVVSVEQGPDDVISTPGEPDGEDRLPTQLVTLKVLKSFKGGTKAGEVLTLTQTGGKRTIPAAKDEPVLENEASLPEKSEGERDREGKAHPHAAPATEMIDVNFVIADDPFYLKGEKYLLMLQRGQGNPKLFAASAPEGRYRIDNKGLLKPMVDNKVTREVKDKTVAQIEKALKADK